MVATRSTRASARNRKQALSSSVANDMDTETNDSTKEEEVVEENAATEPQKNDIGCKKCLQEGDGIETHEVETEYDKPDRTLNYLQGFAKRVIICTMFVMIAKTAWPHVAPIVWPEEPTKEGKLYVLTDRSFRGHVSRGDHFIMMYAPWCGHCQRLKPDWDKLAKSPGVAGVKVSKVDCTVNTVVCKKYDVSGYPTLLYFRNGDLLETYSGAKTLEALRSYLKQKKHKDSSDKAKSKSKKKKDTEGEL